MEQDTPTEITRHLAATVWKLKFRWDHSDDEKWPTLVKQDITHYLMGELDGLLFIDVEYVEPFNTPITEFTKFTNGRTLRLFVWK